MEINYFPSSMAHEMYFNDLRKLVSRSDIKRVCDIGGGANPLLSLDDVKKYGLEYTLLDISSEELEKAPNEYNKVLADITSLDFSLDEVSERYDLIFSKFLAEHVSSGLCFYQNGLKLLKEGGYAFHYFPTLYNIPFLANLLLPEKLSRPILLSFQPYRKQEKQGKFPAKYDWCFGPTRSQLTRLNNLGYEIEKYVGFFGHGFYGNKKVLKLLDRLEGAKTSLLLEHPIPLFTTWAQVLLKKPKASNQHDEKSIL